jgi:hypothetical protein
MKKRILLLCAALVMLSASALAAPYGGSRQHHRYEPKQNFFNGFGIGFGYSFSSYRTVDLTTEEPTSSAMLHGFTLGLTKDFTLIPKSFYFQTGLNYIYQNDSRNEDIGNLKIRLIGDREEHYLALPLKFKYKLELVDNIGLIVDAGPTLLVGLASEFDYRTRISESVTRSSSYDLYTGKVKTNGSSPLFNLEQWMADSGMYPYGKMSRFDVMLGASVGAEFFDILEARVGYDWGLVNRYMKEVADIYSLRRGQFTLSVGIRF